MRLIYEKYGINIELVENQVTTIIIENQRAFSDFIFNLNQQVNGEDGEILLFDRENEVNISKKVVFITNPFDVNCNEKRIINKIYKELQEMTNETLTENCAKVNSTLINIVDEAISLVPYNLIYDFEVNLQEIFKMFNVRIDCENNNLLELVVDYMRAVKSICGIQLIVLLNIKCFLSKSELEELYKFCFYEKIFIINLQGSQFFCTEEEKCYIIDKDICLFEI